MPTAGRPQYVARSVGMFVAQDYPNKELIIVYQRPADLPAIEYPAGTKLVQVRSHIIGARRNEACAHAAGAIIAQWDDDDIPGKNRLTVQAMPIITGQADVTGLQHFVFYEAPTGLCWLPGEELFSEIFVGNVHGGSLVYNREVWRQLAQYPNYRLGEDAEFLRRAMRRGARLQPVHGYDHFVYVRHKTNTWKFEKDNFRRYPGWKQVPAPGWAAPWVGDERVGSY